jgi:hypothetical protein
MIVQEVQRSMEFQLISVMSVEMHRVPFDSMITLIQMKFMKMNYLDEHMMTQGFQKSHKCQDLTGTNH